DGFRRVSDEQSNYDADGERHQHERAQRLTLIIAALRQRKYASTRRRKTELKGQTAHQNDTQAESEPAHLSRLHPPPQYQAGEETCDQRTCLGREEHSRLTTGLA